MSGHLLVVDYNLSRAEEVRQMRDLARRRHDARTVLIRSRISSADLEIADEVLALDPLRPDFADAGERALLARGLRIEAGVVFSDDAVHRGAQLLERLGVPVDAPGLAEGAFSKHRYRLTEAAAADLLRAQRVMVPDFVDVVSLAGLRDFARKHPSGFVIKPAAEGNNRGVVVVGPGDDLTAAFAEVLPYLDGGVICEEFISYRREFSFDGVGATEFVTEKVSATGRYPVEVAQVLPATLQAHERATVIRAGRQANLLVGQCDGPFHNEIKLSDDGLRAAVVEPNRRPGGMRIWALAHWVYGVDLHQRWVDAAFGERTGPEVLVPRRAAACVMLGVSADGWLDPSTVDLHAVVRAAAALVTGDLGLAAGDLVVAECTWLSARSRYLHAVPRDNADFAAQACLVLDTPHVDIRDAVRALRSRWTDALAQHTPAPTPARSAP